jgi:uncharacterized protein (TIGR03032 family)
MTEPVPFSCTYSPNIAEILVQLNCTLAISTYQAGKVIFLSAISNHELMQLPRTFNKAMGMAVNGDKLAISTKDEVIVLVNSPALATSYPKNPNTYDGMYMPRCTYYTGRLDIHDLHYGNEGLWAVNTSFSCLSLIDENYSYIPKWTPPFIKDLEHDDYCHLNGMAMLDGKPTYVTTLGQSSEPKGWKETITSGGLIIDVASGETILRNLAMPHSPRVYDGKLYVLLSAQGELVVCDTDKGTYELAAKVPGFVRGMVKYGDYLFIGRSLLRESSTSFKKLQELPVGKEAKFSGITVVHFPTGNVVGELNYQNSVEEIYDIQVLPNLRRPGILNTETEAYTMGLSTPGKTFWANW